MGVGYDDNISDAQRLVLDVLIAHEGVADDPARMALIEALGESTVNLRAYYWFDDERTSHLKLRSALLRRVKQTLTHAGVSMPDAAREVIFPQGVPLVRDTGKRPKSAPARIEDRWPLGRPAPEISESDRDIAADTDLVERQASRRVEEGDTDLLEKQ